VGVVFGFAVLFATYSGVRTVLQYRIAAPPQHYLKSYSRALEGLSDAEIVAKVGSSTRYIYIRDKIALRKLYIKDSKQSTTLDFCVFQGFF
jgi:hypothetical protein